MSKAWVSGVRGWVSALLIGLGAVIWSAAAQAQAQGDVLWVQIEAHPSLREATERAQDYSAGLQDVNGFALGGGWYGIALGPYRRSDAEIVLRSYRAEGRIPRDSYLVAPDRYGPQFWPVGAREERLDVLETPPAPSAPQQAAAAQPHSGLQDETPAEARRSEQLLSRDARDALQIALQWAGFYTGAIDGAFGAGTRRSMAAWQQANGFEPTGILTTAQRAALLGQYNAILDGLGLETVQDSAAGIEMLIPTERVAFDAHDYPFARYTAPDGGPEQVLLISQSGDQDTLHGLFEIMQTLEIVPLDGPRTRGEGSFTLIGQNARIVSYTEAALRDGQIKGFTLVWPTGDEARRKRMLAAMQGSFTRLSGVLDPSLSDQNAQAVDLVAGLQIRQPKLSRSGFFVNDAGIVVTTTDVVQSCTRITLDETTEAALRLTDAALGLAVLEPQSPVAPRAVAEFAATPPRLQSNVAVSGFSYGGLLGASTMSFGALTDLQGLSGESALRRLEVETLEGDAGGPVFDETGAVLGMLLPRAQGTRQLPPEVNFAADGDGIRAVLLAEGMPLRVRRSADRRLAAPEDISAQARGMTVLVSCWD